MRQGMLLLHRWVGLVITVFLVVVGLTGSLLAFYSEPDRLLSPRLYPESRPTIARLGIAQLADKAAELAPQAQVIAVTLREVERAEVRVAPRSEADADTLEFDTLLLDPQTGEELGRRKWGDLSQGRINLMPFIYRLHNELALGSFGLWLLGIIALMWTLDCFAGLYLTLPACRRELGGSFWQRWQVAWRIKWRGGPYRVVYDLHRASSLWLWLVLIVFAWSSVYMNLWDTVYTWTTRAVLDYQPSWTVVAEPTPPSTHGRLSWREAEKILLRQTDAQSRLHNVQVLSPVALRYSPESGTYTYQFRTNRDVQDRLGMTELIIDAHSGELLAFLLPSGQYSGNTVSSWLSALHKANVFGLTYRIFVCMLGLAITMLSVTGVIIWWKKRKAQLQSRMRRKNGVH